MASAAVWFKMGKSCLSSESVAFRPVTWQVRLLFEVDHQTGVGRLCSVEGTRSRISSVLQEGRAAALQQAGLS